MRPKSEVPTLLQFFEKNEKARPSSSREDDGREGDNGQQQRPRPRPTPIRQDSFVSMISMGQESYVADLLNQQACRETDRMEEALEDAKQLYKEFTKSIGIQGTEEEFMSFFERIAKEKELENQSKYKQQDEDLIKALREVEEEKAVAELLSRPVGLIKIHEEEEEEGDDDKDSLIDKTLRSSSKRLMKVKKKDNKKRSEKDRRKEKDKSGRERTKKMKSDKEKRGKMIPKISSSSLSKATFKVNKKTKKTSTKNSTQKYDEDQSSLSSSKKKKADTSSKKKGDGILDWERSHRQKNNKDEKKNKTSKSNKKSKSSSSSTSKSSTSRSVKTLKTKESSSSVCTSSSSSYSKPMKLKRKRNRKK